MVDKLSCFVEDLVNPGPLKPEILRGLTTPDTIESAKFFSYNFNKIFKIKKLKKRNDNGRRRKKMVRPSRIKTWI